MFKNMLFLVCVTFRFVLRWVWNVIHTRKRCLRHGDVMCSVQWSIYNGHRLECGTCSGEKCLECNPEGSYVPWVFRSW